MPRTIAKYSIWKRKQYTEGYIKLEEEQCIIKKKLNNSLESSIVFSKVL